MGVAIIRMIFKTTVAYLHVGNSFVECLKIFVD